MWLGEGADGLARDHMFKNDFARHDFALSGPEHGKIVWGKII